MRPMRSPRFAKSVCLLIALLVCSPGCLSKWINGSGDLKTEEGMRRELIKEKLEAEDRPRLIVEIGAPELLTRALLENIGLVTQLQNTGGEVKASSQREKILDMMRHRDVHQPNTLLDDPSTTLSVITSVVSPAARKGDILDAVIKTSSHAEATDLQGGWLMEAPLKEMNLLGGQMREGFDRVKAQGRIITNFQINGSEDEKDKVQGIILGAGRLIKERKLGISIDQEYADAITMRPIALAINERFTSYNGYRQAGIATPREYMIELDVPSLYRLDPFHFINVVMRIAFLESEDQRAERIALLQKQVMDPSNVREACWQMEAIGKESIPWLQEALTSHDPKVRFYAAHSLAYLNNASGIPQLRNLSLQEPAFRAMCLNALALLEDYRAEDTLRELIHATEPEVRYGAIRALRETSPNDVSITGREVAGAGKLLEIPSASTPLVALSLSQVAEIVIFGETPRLHIPTFHYVNPRILISPNTDGNLTVSHFSPGKEDQIATCPPDLASTLRAIGEVGGHYGDWVKFLRESHEKGYYAEPLVMNPIPVAGRQYHDPSKENTALSLDGEMVESTYIAPEILQEAAEVEEASVNFWNPLTWGN